MQHQAASVSSDMRCSRELFLATPTPCPHSNMLVAARLGYALKRVSLVHFYGFQGTCCGTAWCFAEAHQLAVRSSMCRQRYSCLHRARSLLGCGKAAGSRLHDDHVSDERQCCLPWGGVVCCAGRSRVTLLHSRATRVLVDNVCTSPRSAAFSADQWIASTKVRRANVPTFILIRSSDALSSPLGVCRRV